MARAVSRRRRVRSRAVRAHAMPQEALRATGPRALSGALTLPRFRVVGRDRLLSIRRADGALEPPLLQLSGNLPVAHVLPDTHDFSKGRFKRDRFLSGAAVNHTVVKPTVDLKRLYYTVPDVMVCVRRKQRREVLAAKGKLGGNHRKPHRTPSSEIICR